jgi:hypothetical protein
LEKIRLVKNPEIHLQHLPGRPECNLKIKITDLVRKIFRVSYDPRDTPTTSFRQARVQP